jgi:pre-mRNA cleavage complex 2 protein Pcf11
MQALLDEAQSDVTNELEKVSLERLADIDPNLLDTLKQSAEELMASERGGSSGGATSAGESQQQSIPSFFVETRPSQVIERSREWQKITFDPDEQIPKLVAELRQSVQSTLTSEATYSQMEAIQMTNTLAAASAVAMHLTQALQRFHELRQQYQDSVANESSLGKTRRYTAVDKSLFTNEGVKKRDGTVIGSLYEIGLPFMSSSDGRRFANQLDLSKHLDYLFKKK